MDGLPRPRLIFRGPDEHSVKSPALIDYAYGLVIDRGYLRVHGAEALSPMFREVLADLLEMEVARLRLEAERVSGRGISSLKHRLGGDIDASTASRIEPTASLAEASGE